VRPIVDGVLKEYKSYRLLARVDFHSKTKWHEMLSLFGVLDFVLMDASEKMLYRWIGFTEKEGFVYIIDPFP
jgi:hypothetical protein